MIPSGNLFWIQYTIFYRKKPEYLNENTSYSLNCVVSTLNFLILIKILKDLSSFVIFSVHPPGIGPMFYAIRNMVMHHVFPSRKQTAGGMVTSSVGLRR